MSGNSPLAAGVRRERSYGDGQKKREFAHIVSSKVKRRSYMEGSSTIALIIMEAISLADFTTQ